MSRDRDSRAHFRKHGTSARPVDDVDDYEDAADAHIQLIGRALPGASESSSSSSSSATSSSHMPRPPRGDKFAELRAGVVTDARGQQRFHGAFTGGFSAGYFNSVGSIAGFQPAAFVSSRARRAEAAAPRAQDYMDDEDRADSAEAGKTLVAKSEFDTFGATENEVARRRTAAVGKALASLVVPASDSVGVRLLKKMGWRDGDAIGGSNAKQAHAASDDGDGDGDARSFAAYVARVDRQQALVKQRAVVAQSARGSAPDTSFAAVAAATVTDDDEYRMPPPKHDAHGLGFDAAAAAGPEITQWRAMQAHRNGLDDDEPAVHSTVRAF